MRIFIAGAGEVGTHLAKLLSHENHDIILMDEDSEKVEFAYDNSLEIMPVVGVPTSISQLKAAGAGSAELFIAVTPEESQNIVACMLASKLGALKTMARINNSEYQRPENINYFHSLGINAMVYPEALAADEIHAGLRLPWTRQYWTLFGGKLNMVAVRVGPESPLVGKKLLELGELDQKIFHVLAIVHDGMTMIASGADVIQANDIIYVTAEPSKLDEVRRYCGQEVINVQKIIIMGGSRIALKTIERLPSDLNIKLIEKDYEKCKKLSEIVPGNALVIHGDGRDPDLLKSEGIKNTQAFLALTSNSESNMLATLNAKRLGVPRSVAQIENIDYLDIASQMGIGNLINKKLIAAAFIFRHLLQVDVSNAKTLAIGKGDVFEIIVSPNSRVTKRSVRELKLPTSMTLGGVMRGGEVSLVSGDTQIQAGDVVMVFSTNISINHVMKYFS